MIRGKNIILRTIRESDLDSYFEIVNDLSNMSNHWPIDMKTETYMRKEFEKNGFWEKDYKIMIITDKEGNLIGEVDNCKSSPNIQGSEVGYRIFRKADMDKGYITESVRLWSAYL